MGHFKHPSSCSNTQPNLFFFFFSVVFVYWRETVYKRGGRAEGGREDNLTSSHQVPAASSAQLTRTLAYI